MAELLSVRMDEELTARLDVLTASWGASRSEVVRRAVLLAPSSLPSSSASSSVPELRRVDLVVPVRPESIEWLDELARVCHWTRDQAARQALSEGRRVLTLKLARKPTGGGRPTPDLRVVPEDRLTAGAPTAEDAPTPA